jgi:hypothetical protein
VALTVRKIELWRVEVDNKPGTLSGVLGPLAEAGADLQVVMGYHISGTEKSGVELFPVKGRGPNGKAKAVGLTPSPQTVLHVEGDNRAGLGSDLAKAVAEAGVNISFLVAQTIAKKFSAVFGFASADDAKKAILAIKKAGAAKKPAAAKKTATKAAATSKPPPKAKPAVVPRA